jgi:hypothetical protein
MTELIIHRHHCEKREPITASTVQSAPWPHARARGIHAKILFSLKERKKDALHQLWHEAEANGLYTNRGHIIHRQSDAESGILHVWTESYAALQLVLAFFKGKIEDLQIFDFGGENNKDKH